MKEPTYDQATDVLMDAFKNMFPGIRFVTVDNLGLSDEELNDLDLQDMDDGEPE